jgi:short subunit dehydrogenase-like uncharacterized protein
MAGRIVLFGATGYTGRLTADALLARGARPVLAARNQEAVEGMAAELGGLETAVGDVANPASVHALVDKGDVMLATVGPFARYGDPAAEAAIAAGAWYLDSTGEPVFVRRVFEDFGPRAERNGTGMVTAFGYDWVPGNLAGAMALKDAGEAATRVDVGYFTTGGGLGGMSGGTRASAAGAMIEPSFAWRGGIRTERGAKRMRKFQAAGRERPAISVGASEHFTLPRIHPGLREVNAYLGWFGSRSRALQAVAAVNAPVLAIPGARKGFRALTSRVSGSTGGPSEADRAPTGSVAVAIAYGPGGEELSTVEVQGPNGYDLTARMLAWGATHAAKHGMLAVGALGPVEAFGHDAFVAGCAEAGLERV